MAVSKVFWILVVVCVLSTVVSVPRVCEWGGKFVTLDSSQNGQMSGGDAGGKGAGGAGGMAGDGAKAPNGGSGAGAGNGGNPNVVFVLPDGTTFWRAPSVLWFLAQNKWFDNFEYEFQIASVLLFFRQFGNFKTLDFDSKKSKNVHHIGPLNGIRRVIVCQ